LTDEGRTDGTQDAHRISRRRLVGGAAVGAAGIAIGADPAIAKRRHRKLSADVVVVGAGLAGLTAALGFKAEGKSVIVLEARDRVGGRVVNHKLGHGVISERGGTFTGPTQDRIQAMAERFNVDTFPTFADGDNVYVNSTGTRSTYSDTLPTGTAPPDPLILPDLLNVVMQLDSMAAEIDVEAPYNAPDAAAKDGQTFESWINDNAVSPTFKQIVSLATRPIFGAEPREISLLYVLFYIAASGNEENVGTFERNFNTRDGAQESRFVGGSGQIPIRMAKALGKRVIKGAPVTKIKQTGSGVTVHAKGHTVKAKRVVVAIPPALAGRIEYSPILPAERDQLTQRSSQGTLMKAACVYDTPFWREDGLNGSVVSFDGPLQVAYDASPPDGSKGIVFGFIGGDLARSFGSMGPNARKAAVVANLTKYYGAEAADPEDYFESDWTSEEWSRGCPVGFTSPGALVAYGKHVRQPVGRIHWAGTETSGYWVGYMDGAVRSGERVVAEVLADL
jgi:monoamine oxidase